MNPPKRGNPQTVEECGLQVVESTGTAKTTDGNLPKPLRAGKQYSMLYLFAQGARLHRFDAERLGDHVLPSTVSDLQKSHGIHFNREMIKVPTRFGVEARVALYWLDGGHLERARKVCGISEEGGS